VLTVDLPASVETHAMLKSSPAAAAAADAERRLHHRWSWTR